MPLVQKSILTELKASGRLPSPTGVALTILELSRDPSTSTEDIAQVLKGDPSLAGRVLKYANSADSGSRSEITSINDALVRLGMSMVRQLCLGFSVLSNAQKGQCRNFDYPAFWSHSLARAVLAQGLGARVSSFSPEEAFTCALLSSIGSLGLASVYPKEYSEILAEWTGVDRADLTRLEQRELSIDQHQVSVALFEDWNLPEFYRTAVAHLDDQTWIDTEREADASAQSRHLARLLNVADLGSRICVETGPDIHRFTLEFAKVGENHAIPDDEWSALFDQAVQEWGRMGKVLGIATQRVSAMEDLVRRAQQYDPQVIDDRRPAGGDRPDENPIAAAPQPPTEDAEATEADCDHALSLLIALADPAETAELARSLEAGGHHLSFASDGHEALKQVLETKPHLVLADQNLPGRDGLELCRTLRQSDQTIATQVILLGEGSADQQIIEAVQAGANDYLPKPPNGDLLAAKLDVASRWIKLQEQTAQDHEEKREMIVALGKAYRQVEQMALEDQLTELPNRRAGLDVFEKEWARALRHGTNLLCMILDIDHFKHVNDTFGHDIGDVVLKETAAVLKQALRDSDTVCRFGGEEFLVLCPEADLEMAMQIGDRIRRTVQDNRVQDPEFSQETVTISVGVAFRTDEHDSPKDLIKLADEALYAAKEAGRNRVCIANSI